jgi:hypothetical protein
MKHKQLLALAAVATSIAPFARGQGPLGPWNPGNVLYVSTIGTDIAGSGATPSTAFQHLTFALTEAAQRTAGNGLPTTINVAPGTYSAATTGETFPISVPAYGVSIEARGSTAPVFDANSQTSTGFDVIEVRNLIDPWLVLHSTIQPSGLPPTNINGLVLTKGHRGLFIWPLVQTGVVSAPVRMEVRDCEMFKNAIGIHDEVVSFFDEAVLEHNSIHDNFDAQVSTAPAFGIDIHSQLQSSLLIRANRIWHNEVNLQIINTTSDANDCRERVFSNFIEKGEQNIFMGKCACHVTNNTIAFATSFGGAAPIGIVYNDGGAVNARLTLRNNIIWNPGQFPPTTGVEDIHRVGTFIDDVFNNDIEDKLDVDVVLGQANFSEPPNFESTLSMPEDLHIKAIVQSPAIWSGANPDYIRAATDSGGNPPQPMTPYDPTMIMLVGGNPMRIDIPVDVDLDSRILQAPTEASFLPDIGADEVAFTAATVPSLAPFAPIDPFGTISPTGGNWTGNVRVKGPVGANASLMMCLNIPAPSNPTDQSTLIVPLGFTTLDLSNSSTIGFGTINASGFFDFPINLGAFSTGLLESDAYVQALVTDPTGNWISARVRVETDN